jgi:hypothetical protein
MVWDGTTTVHDKWGWAPAQVYPLQLELKMKTGWSHLRITPMDPMGNLRTAQADTIASDSSGFVRVDLDQQADFTLWYAVEGLEIEEEEDSITAVPIGQSLRRIRCYPNPASREIFFEVDGEFQSGSQLIIRDLSGRAVYEGMLTNRLRVDTSPLPPGIYFYRVQGKMAKTGRFSVSR